MVETTDPEIPAGLVEHSTKRNGRGRTVDALPNGADMWQQRLTGRPERRLVGVERKRSIHEIACRREPAGFLTVHRHSVPYNLLDHAMDKIPRRRSARALPAEQRI